MTRRLAILAAVLGAFCTSAVAVAYFSDAKETHETVLSGPPISAGTVLKLLSNATDTSTLGYAQKNRVNGDAATGGDTTSLAIDLGRRANADQTAWKNGSFWFYRTFTVQMPANAPVGSAVLTLEQSAPVPPLSSGASAFEVMEFASINTSAINEFTGPNPTPGFGGTTLSAPVTITPNTKLQVNLKMASTSLNSAGGPDQRVRLTLTVVATLPDGSEFRYPISVLFCDHQSQCG